MRVHAGHHGAALCQTGAERLHPHLCRPPRPDRPLNEGAAGFVISRAPRKPGFAGWMDLFMSAMPALSALTSFSSPFYQPDSALEEGQPGSVSPWNLLAAQLLQSSSPFGGGSAGSADALASQRALSPPFPHWDEKLEGSWQLEVLGVVSG